MEARYFDIEGICQFQVYGERHFVEAVSKELYFYQIDPGQAPITLDLEFELNPIKKFKPSENPTHLPPYDFQAQHKLAKWVIRFERLAQSPYRIKFYGNAFSRMILAKQIIEPAIRWFAQSLGFIFVHSTCLCQKGRGVLIAGRGGAGKTGILLNWLKEGNPFLSDDFTILSYRSLRRFITPIRLSAGILFKTGIYKNLRFSRQMEIYSRTGLRKLLFNYAKLQAKLKPEELFSGLEIAETAELKSVLVLAPSAQELEPISPEEMAQALSEINQEESYDFPRYLSGLSERTQDPSYKNYFLNQKERLWTYLKEIPGYKVNPRSLKISQVYSLLSE